MDLKKLDGLGGWGAYALSLWTQATAHSGPPPTPDERVVGAPGEDGLAIENLTRLGGKADRLSK